MAGVPHRTARCPTSSLRVVPACELANPVGAVGHSLRDAAGIWTLPMIIMLGDAILTACPVRPRHATAPCCPSGAAAASGPQYELTSERARAPVNT